MIVESYVLESVWLLAMAITLGQPAYDFFGESVTGIEVSLTKNRYQPLVMGGT
jgi:hypothetical protein